MSVATTSEFRKWMPPQIRILLCSSAIWAMPLSVRVLFGSWSCENAVKDAWTYRDLGEVATGRDRAGERDATDALVLGEG